MNVSLRPFRAEQLPLLWSWMNEDTLANFDDGSDGSFEVFANEMVRRIESEYLFGIYADGTIVGAVGMKVMPDGSGLFRGLCVGARWHRQGFASVAVVELERFAASLKAVDLHAYVFSDNVAVQRLFEKLGAKQFPCVLVTRRNGAAVPIAHWRFAVKGMN